MDDPKMEERRRHPRHSVAIPCQLHWQSYIVRGRIANLSLGGALLDNVSALPPTGTCVILELGSQQNNVLLRGRITSRVIHSIWVGELGTFGVRFEEPVERIQAKLGPFLASLGMEATSAGLKKTAEQE